MRGGRRWEKSNRRKKEESEAGAALEEEDTSHVRPARPHTKALFVDRSRKHEEEALF